MRGFGTVFTWLVSWGTFSCFAGKKFFVGYMIAPLSERHVLGCKLWWWLKPSVIWTFCLEPLVFGYNPCRMSPMGQPWAAVHSGENTVIQVETPSFNSITRVALLNKFNSASRASSPFEPRRFVDTIIRRVMMTPGSVCFRVHFFLILDLQVFN